MSRARPAAALLLTALAFAACGDDDDERGDVSIEGGTDTGAGVTTGTETGGTRTTPAPAGRSSETVRVRETEFAIDPENPRIARTGIVTFRVRNAGKIVHSLEVEGPAGEQETESIQPGDSATLKVNFNRPGRYKWYCPIGDHEQDGMVGTVIVGSGSGSGAEGRDDRGGSRTEREDESSGSGRGRGSDDDSGTGGGVGGY